MDPAILAMLMQQKQGIVNGGGQFLSGMFGHSDRPFEKYGQEYQKYNQEGQDTQNPFYKAGTEATGNFQNWLKPQQDSTQFINNLMGQYQQSPWAKFQQQQGQNAANNAASASGLVGSTPYMQASQDYAHNISSQDQNQWLQNVLGVNKQYGEGQNNLMQGGQHAGDMISQLQQLLGQNMGESAYGQQAGKNFDTGNKWGGGLKFLFG